MQRTAATSSSKTVVTGFATKMQLIYSSLFIISLTFGKVNNKNRMKTSQYVKTFENSFDSIFDKVELPILEESSNDFESGSSVRKQNYFFIINDDQQLEENLQTGNLQLLIFLYLGDPIWKNQLDHQNFQDFLKNYNEAADFLSGYSIKLGLVNCSSEVSTEFCSPEKAGNFAHGFQNQQEKIGFPIETLFSIDSIVASTLHLSLLYSVPIIQSMSERKGLEDKHRFKKDIVLSLHKSLGTREHRLFLEISEKYKSNFVFAITTYSSAIYGLPNALSPEEISEMNPLIFILHCSNGETIAMVNAERGTSDDRAANIPVKASDSYDPCAVVSFYDGQFQNPDFPDFLNLFQQPLWDDIKPQDLLLNSSVSNLFFNDTKHPKVMFVYDVENENRVISTVPTIAKLLIGSVKIFTINQKYLTKDLQNFIKIDLSEMRTPAVLFIPGNKETSLLNDFDEALPWIQEELKYMKTDRRKIDNQEEIRVIHQLFDLAELQEDDEVAKEMISEDSFTLIRPLQGEAELKELLQSLKSGTLVVAFYLSWDPVSNMVLQHLQEAAGRAKEIGSNVFTHRVNCFDWTDLCDGLDVVTFPALKLWKSNQTVINYEGPIDAKRMLLAVLLLECEDQPLNLSSEKYEFPFASLAKTSSCLAINAVSSITTGIFSSKEDAAVFLNVAEKLLGFKLTGIHINEKTVENVCLTGKGCLVISKKEDLFQTRFIINEFMNDSDSLLKLIDYHAENVFGSLNPSNSAVTKFDEDCKAAETSWRNIIVVLILASCSRNSTTVDFTNCIEENIQNIINRSMSSDSNEYCINNYYAGVKERFSENEHSQCVESKGTNRINVLSLEDGTFFSDVGHVATQLSSPGLVFSFICSKDELGVDLLETYKLNPEQSHLVAVRKGHGQVFLFENESHGRSAIRQWLKSVLNGNVSPKLLLQSNDWTPALEGFDYLSFMEEDMIREAEEQLAYDMEIDIGAFSSRGNQQNTRRRN